MTTARRQRATPSPAFSTGMSAFLSCGAFPYNGETFLPRTSRQQRMVISCDNSFGTVVETSTSNSFRKHNSILTVAAPLQKVDSPRPKSRFGKPVPTAKPHEILPRRRGRNARKRSIEAEHFRKYIHLRRQLKPWSDEFRAKHGRTPSLIDVHASDIPGLSDRFMEYLEALERLRVEV